MLILSGLTAGALHVVAGPDHLAALAPLAAHGRARAARIGFRWGLGHGLGAVTLGALGILSRGLIDVDAWSTWAEFAVGFTLIAVGVWSFRSAMKLVVHTHEHRHDGSVHQHLHVHGAKAHTDRAHVQHSHAAFFVGMLHGAAGTGHLLAVLPSLALPPAQAVVYLSAYLVAAVASMTGFATMLGFLAHHRRALPLRPVLYATSLAAVGVGCWWIQQSWPA